MSALLRDRQTVTNPCPRGRISEAHVAAVLVAILIVFTTAAWAEAPYDDENTTAGWAWARIKNNEVADFGKRCGELDPHQKAGWEDPCRGIPAQFLVDVLTVPKWRDQLVRHSVRLRGIRIEGSVDLSDAEVTLAVGIESSRIEGDLFLQDTHLIRLFLLQGSTLAGTLSASRLRADNGILLRNHVAIEGQVELDGARIGGDLEMQSCSFKGAVSAEAVKIEGSLFMNHHATFGGDVDLRAAEIGRNLEMETSSFAGSVTADAIKVENLFMNDHAAFRGAVDLHAAKIAGGLSMEASSFESAVRAQFVSVGESLLLRNRATFRSEIDLSGAKIGFNLEMRTSSFSGAVYLLDAEVGASLFMDDHAMFLSAVNASRLGVKGSLFMDHARFNDQVNLVGAKVGSVMGMDSSSFRAAVDAEALSVAESLFIRDHATFGRELVLYGAKIGGTLNLDAATAWQVDLSGADAQEINLGGLGWWCLDGKVPRNEGPEALKASVDKSPVHWRLGTPAWREARCDGTNAATLPRLILRNFHVQAFQDSVDAWPPAMDLEGFRYDRLGGRGGVARDDMRQRSAVEWTDWIERDRIFSTQPYAQLSTVLVAAGRRNTAEAIQFAGQERGRSEAWKRGDFGSWAWMSVLSSVLGYGIGLYTFRVLRWVGGFTLLGAVVLWCSPNARARWFPPSRWLRRWLRGGLCLLGASLHRLLPIVKLSKEFEDFYDNPPDNPRNLKSWQVSYFAVHAIAGWVFGLFLLAALSGLTQKG